MSFSFLSSDEYDEQAHRLYDAGEYEQALVLLQEGLSQYPDSADLHVALGYVRLAREEFAWALHSFRNGLAADPDHEDGWVGLGETLLKFGRIPEALACFERVDELGLGEELDLGLAIGRALYREALFRESRDRLARLAAAHPDVADVRAALGYAFHALGDDLGARRELRSALRLDASLHEVRIYLSHLHFERGDSAAALRELDAVPPEEHWDPLSLWRYIEMKGALEGLPEEAPALAPWRDRLAQLQEEPDEIDHLLAEVETAFEESGDDEVDAALATPLREMHTVRTTDGHVFSGTWEEIVCRMRDALSSPEEPVNAFMRRAARHARNLTGCDVPFDDAEAFIRESARVGLLRIED